VEDPTNHYDDDCDSETDENPYDKDCQCSKNTGADPEAFTCAIEIGCNSEFIVGTPKIISVTGDKTDNAFKAIKHFGNTDNDLKPRGRNSYGILTSGEVESSDHSVNIPGSFAGSGSSTVDPVIKDDDTKIYDVMEYQVTMKAPSNATGFVIDYVFFSAEYDDYVGTKYNDKFYIMLRAEETTKNKNLVINYTNCRNPEEYYDLKGDDCALDSGYCCYIAINTALSDCCWYDGCKDFNESDRTDISGTGFECDGSSDKASDGHGRGSSTGWLSTTWEIKPNEKFTLTFHIHDTNDSKFDSAVLIDNFRWTTGPIEMGTVPVEIR
jgi:hypothetical protein